ncbi:UNVERIFIED_CONTAM: hypothetical protein Cloal_1621 [Acetivibrio alkalicellulosi]
MEQGMQQIMEHGGVMKVFAVHRYRSSPRVGKPLTWRRVPDRLILNLKRMWSLTPLDRVVNHRRL